MIETVFYSFLAGGWFVYAGGCLLWLLYYDLENVEHWTSYWGHVVKDVFIIGCIVACGWITGALLASGVMSIMAN